MVLKIEDIHHNDYLEFIVTGSHDLNDAIDKFAHILDIAKLTGLNRVLIDYRQLTYSAGGTEKALYAFGTEAQYLKYLKSGGQELQIAYLAPTVNTYEPGAEIGKKIQSVQFELFDNLDEALEWLKIT